MNRSRFIFIGLVLLCLIWGVAELATHVEALARNQALQANEPLKLHIPHRDTRDPYRSFAKH